MFAYFWPSKYIWKRWIESDVIITWKGTTICMGKWYHSFTTGICGNSKCITPEVVRDILFIAKFIAPMQANAIWSRLVTKKCNFTHQVDNKDHQSSSWVWHVTRPLDQRNKNWVLLHDLMFPYLLPLELTEVDDSYFISMWKKQHILYVSFCMNNTNKL